MNLDDISKSDIINPGAHGNYPGLILIGVLMLIGAVIASALWPEQIDPVSLSGIEMAQARDKVKLLQKKDAATGPVVFTEAEVNMLFHYLLSETPRKSENGAGRESFSGARITIGPRDMSIVVNYSFGPWTPAGISIGPCLVTYKVAGVLENSPEGLRFHARAGAIGHLPLSFFGREAAMSRLKRLLQPFSNARAFLSGLEMVGMERGSIKVAVKRKT